VLGVRAKEVFRIGSPYLQRAGILLVCWLAVLSSRAQGAKSTAWVDSVYRTFENKKSSEAKRDLTVLDSVLSLLQLQRDTCRMARVSSWRSHSFEQLGQLESAVLAAQQGLNWFEPECDSLILMSVQVNLANAFLALEEYDRVLAICETSLGAWNDAWPYSKARNGLYTDRAIALANKGAMDEALDAFRDVLRNALREKVLQDEADALINLGAIFGMMGETGSVESFRDSSARYQVRAMSVLRSLGDRFGQMLLYGNLASSAYDGQQPRVALAYLDTAAVLARDLQDLEQATSISDLRSRCYFALGRTDSAYKYLQEHLVLKDSLLSIEKVKAIADVQEKYESEKKVRTIKELEVKQLASNLRQEKLERTRNIYLFSALGVLLAAGGLLSRLRFVHRSRAAIQKEKDISEGLLLNILPEEVAAELKAKGEAEARLIDEVTVLFTDFKGFTAMSEKLSPKELVRDIHECFSEFDRIMERHGIEKIKTIGDAYMAAGGLPIPNGTHAFDVVNAALEIRDFIQAGKALKIAQGLPFFEIRVGVHTGPVVAGIVGLKKFAYDIWGDTVNTASRMESSGSPGEVNISESTYALIKSDPRFRFTERGKVSAKGKGELSMYFVDRSA
jgi:class 3 adenylate cyclase